MLEPEEAFGRCPQLCEPGGGDLGRRLKVAPARHEENRTVKPRHIAIIKPGQTGQKLDQRRADARTCRMIVRCIFGRQQPRLLFVIEVGAARGEPTEIDDPFALHEELLERRSEEHTSELQSLMRISYAVFCLKKKKQYYTQYNHITKNM